MSHPFGDLVHQHLHRKHGLTQSKLAEGIFQDPAVISNMCKGRRLTGGQARERVVAIVRWLHEQQVLAHRQEADALLHAAGLIGLRADTSDEAELMALLSTNEHTHSGQSDDYAGLIHRPSQRNSYPTSNLPLPTTPFVGRQRELERLFARLEDPECRLLTLVGPGGFGKTRLGIRLGELATERSNLAHDGVFFVALDGLENPSWVVPAIASALGFSFHEQAEQEKRLFSYLSNKRLLLILDNAEEILDPKLVVRVLRHTHDLKILVTSRAALNVREEWFHPISGMSLDGDNDLRHVDDVDYQGEAGHQTDAMELFSRCAVRVSPDFELAREYAHVKNICRSVGGVPLAIELAAAWLKALTCEQIARELIRGIDILTSRMQDVPERHRSLRVVLEQTWRYLSGEEQRVFRQLSVFAGGFRRPAAQAVTGTTLPILAGLVDKSVLQLGQDGRYRIHALLRQMGEERLGADPHEIAEVSERHCSYFMKFLRDRSKSVAGPNQRRVLSEVQAEMDNIRRAWAFAARHNKFDTLQEALPCLLRFLWVRGRYEEGEELLAETLTALEGVLLPKNGKSLRTELLARRALFVAATGEIERATSILAETQTCIEITQMSHEQALCDYVAGMIFTFDYVPNAYAPLKVAYASFQALGDAPALAETALRLAFIVHWMFGDFAAGRSLLDESLSIFRELGDLSGIADALSLKAGFHCANGSYDIAEECLRECLQLAGEIDNPLLVARVTGVYAEVAYGRSQPELAIRLARERLEAMRQLGHGSEIRISVGKLGYYYVGTGRYDEAIELYDGEARFSTASISWGEQALIAVGRYAEAYDALKELAAEIADGERRYYTSDNLISWAALLASDCELRQDGMPLLLAPRNRLTREILTLVRDYDPDRSRARSRDRATKLLAELDERHMATETSVSAEHATPRSVEEIVRDLLTISLT